MHRYTLSFIVAVLIVYFVVCIAYFVDYMTKKKLHTKCFVINLEKNKLRLERFTYFYNNSDISVLPIERFNAINGRELDPKKYITEHAYETLLENENNRFRTRHYQLTRGAIGCYLSHTAMYQKLLDDPKYDYYIIFEDDAAILPNVLDKLNLVVNYAPADWDMLLLAPIMEVLAERPIDANTHLFRKLDTFWGLCGYVINKKGARKFMEEFGKKRISMQIDSKMSYMILHGDFNVYAFNEKTIWHDRSLGTDIQMPLKKTQGVNPFYIEDL